MKKWDLILCQKTFFESIDRGESIFGEDDDEQSYRRRMIRKHHIVISDNLMKTYKQYAIANGLLAEYMAFQTEYAALEESTPARDRFKPVFDDDLPTTDIDQAMLCASQDEGLDYPLIICDVCEKCRYFKNKLLPTPMQEQPSLLLQQVTNLIGRNTAWQGHDFSAITEKGQPCILYEEWLKEIFLHEKNIVFFDQHMMNESGYGSFFDHYIKCIEANSTITMYIDLADPLKGDRWKWNYYSFFEGIKQNICDKAHEKGIRILIYNFNHNKTGRYRKSYHERHIYVEEYKIVITKGIDFLPPQRGGTRSIIMEAGVTATLSKSRSSQEIAKLLREYDGYELILDTDN